MLQFRHRVLGGGVFLVGCEDVGANGYVKNGGVRFFGNFLFFGFGLGLVLFDLV